MAKIGVVVNVLVCVFSFFLSLVTARGQRGSGIKSNENALWLPEKNHWDMLAILEIFAKKRAVCNGPSILFQDFRAVAQRCCVMYWPKTPAFLLHPPAAFSM